MTFDPDMEQYDNDFDNAEAEEGFRDVPEGTYQAYIDTVEFNTPTWANYPLLQLNCKIIGGDFDGLTVKPKAGCDPDYIHYLKSMLVKMGYEVPPKPSQIRGELEGMLNRVLEVYVAKKKPDSKFANCYVNSYIRSLDPDEQPPPPSDLDDPTRRW